MYSLQLPLMAATAKRGLKNFSLVTLAVGGLALCPSTASFANDAALQAGSPIRQLLDYSNNCQKNLELCAAPIPSEAQVMAQIQQLTTNQPDVKLLSLTVDPRDDTTAVLSQYGLKYGADTNRWWLLTGDDSTLYHLIGASFLNADMDDPFTYMPGNWSHTERIAVVDPQGKVRAYFDGLSENVAAAVVDEIGRLRE